MNKPKGTGMPSPEKVSQPSQESNLPNPAQQADAPASPAESAMDPKVSLGAPDPASTVKVKEESTGFMVTALQKGFYNNQRKNSGDRFLVSSRKKWGAWMKCDDEKLHSELVQKNKERMNQIRKAEV